MKLRTVKKNQLPKCWLFEGKDYVLTAPGGEPIRRDLPYVDPKYESALKEQGISCRVVAVPNKLDPNKEFHKCEYWDSYDSKQEKLPVYTKMQDKEDTYLYTGEYLTKEVVSGKTVGMALKMRAKVQYACAKKDLDGKMAKVMYLKNGSQKEIELDGAGDGKIKMLQVYTAEGEPTKYYGVFDMAKVESTPYVEVHTPNQLKALAIGKNGQNKGYWEYLLGGKKIMIV